MYVLDYVIEKPLYGLREEVLTLFLEYITNHVPEVRLTKHKIELCENVVGCFISNTYYNHLAKREKILITLNENVYSNDLVVNGRYIPRKVSYTYTRHLLEFLYTFEYIDMKLGGVSWVSEREGAPRVMEKTSSYITLKTSLTDLYNKVTVSNKIKKKKNVLLLRDRDKKPKTFKQSVVPEASIARSFLDRYNTFCRQHKVSRVEVVYDVQLHKVYTMNFRRGARSFMNGSIQTLSKQERSEVTIDGDSCVCYDYVAFEPSLAYSMLQEVMEGDPYTIILDGYDPVLLRSICKVFLNTMFNTKSRATATKAMTKHIMDKYKPKELQKAGLIPYDYIPVNKIVDILEQKHSVIYSMFYDERGLDLQYTGSLINDYILEYMMQSENELTMQVHDCFIVREEAESKIKEVMIRGYEQVLGFSDNCKIQQEF